MIGYLLLSSLLAASTAYLAEAFTPRTAFLVLPSTQSTSADFRGRLRMATVAEDVSQLDSEALTTKTPIILLAGFLGTGKTTTLKNLLENTQGSKIGVIVNDVASVNIDAKLVASMPDAAAAEDMIELQNGCACCSLSDELFSSVETLFRPKEGKKSRDYDALVVELSGVADPMAIAATWKAAASSDRYPATNFANISKIVTMIDACTFGTDYMTWDAANQRPGWVEAADDCSGHRKVSELLAEQVEAANLILVNKIDMAEKEEVDIATKVARALNDRATIHSVAFGKIQPKEILELGTTGVKTGPMENVGSSEEETKESESGGHSHSHDHACEDPDCADESHSHSHEHASTCNDPDCTDKSHAHSHSHEHSSSCSDPDCTDESHSHSHEHSSSCSDPDCTDTSHSHSHDHATSTDNLGIVNFVYKATRPFDMKRLMAILNTWPVPVKESLDLEILNDAKSNGYDMGDGLIKQDSPFVGVLRSKGFAWLAPSKWSGANDDAYRHDTAMYWSHAGKHFSLNANGKWWGSIQMFDGWENYMKKLFKDNMGEYERIMREDFVSDEFADRRQELVFIGTNLDQDEITKTLDGCLLTDKEMGSYRQKLKNYQDTVLNASGGGKSLFDTDGGVEHTDA